MNKAKLEYFESLHASNEINKLDNLDKSLEEEYRLWLIDKLKNTMERIEKQQQEHLEKEAQKKRDKDWYL